MKLVRLQIGAALLVLAALSVGVPQIAYANGGAEEVVATAYTCEENPSNPMYPCGPLRWGGDIHSIGMACPVDWRGRTFDVPEMGTLACDDTQEINVWDGLPHVDIRVPTLGDAHAWGVRRITLQPPVRTLPSEADAVDYALAQVDRGDPDTAMARLLTFARAREKFPSLVEGIALPPQHPVWIVTIWVPAEDIPADAVAQPNPDADIASAYFVFDAMNRTVVADGYVSSDVLHTMGWISQDSFEFNR